MSENQNPIDHDDPRLEVIQAVYDRVNSWEESATPEQIRAELDAAIDQAGVDLPVESREQLTAHIHGDGGREDVATIL